MFHQLIQHKRDEWYASPDCTVGELIAYIIKRGMMRDAVKSNPAAAALLEYALLKDRKDKPIAPNLAEHINNHVEELQFKRIFRDIFYGVDYTDYLFSLPMGAGKKYPEPEGAELEFASLDTPSCLKRIVLLVQIGKEGWDCKSLMGVILPHQYGVADLLPYSKTF